MAHNITDRDNVVLHGKPAWHGLGTVVKDAPTPAAALQIARLSWQVERTPLLRERQDVVVGENGVETTKRVVTVASHVANVRQDTDEVLGVVGADYEIVQNEDLAGLIVKAAGTADVKVESAGSFRGGRDVFFLAHLSTFQIGPRDRSHLYALVTNSHDGTRALTVLPTSVRVVCANTLRAALSGREASRLTVALRHTKNLEERLPEVVTALRGAREVAKREEEKARALASRTLSRDEVKGFFTDAFVALYGAPPKIGPASTRGERTRATRAVETVSAWAKRLTSEVDVLGENPTAWLALNAITGWADHDRPTRGDTDRNFANIFGTSAAAKDKAVEVALALV